MTIENLVPVRPKPSPWPWLGALSLSFISMGFGMSAEPSSTTAGVSAAAGGLVVILFGQKFILAIGKIFRSANMNTLIGISILASFGLSIWNWSKGDLHHLYFEAASFIAAFVLFGQYLEGWILWKMHHQMSGLALLLPKKVRRISDNATEQEIDIGEIRVGDQLKILVGERVPADSIILSDQGATFDESVLTGESNPVTKLKSGHAVQGALNVGQPILVRVTQIPGQSLYANLVREVQTSLSSKPEIQKSVDRIATIFVPLVVLIAAAAGYYWWRQSPETDLFVQTTIAVLVIACPCALGMATPTALFAGALRAGRKGILLKSLDAVDRVGDLTQVAFDKTGTLTEGRPSVQRVKAVDHVSHTEILEWALAVERDSEHPYAQAIRTHALKERARELQATDIKVALGRGVCGSVQKDKATHQVVVGNLVWMFENDFDSTQVPADLVWESEGTHETSIWVGVDKKILGIIFLADKIREGVAKTLEVLTNEGLEVGMITGDSEVVAKAMAKSLKLKFIHAGVLPSEKATIIKRLHTPKKKGLDYLYQKVAFVGDGVNDGPALAEAHIGISMGSGSSLAQSTADVVLLSNDIRQVPATLEILRQTKTLVLQNLFLSFGYNILAIPVAAGVLYSWKGILLNPMIAAGAMALSSLSVLGNSLRALRS